MEILRGHVVGIPYHTVCHTYHVSYNRADDDVEDKYVQTQKVEHHTFFAEEEVEQHHPVQYLVEMIGMVVVAVVTDSAADSVAADSAVAVAVAVAVVQLTIDLELVSLIVDLLLMMKDFV